MKHSGRALSLPLRVGSFKTAFTLFIFSFVLVSCGPVIHSFQVSPLTITAADSVKVNWVVSGTPTMVIHERGEGAGIAGDGERAGMAEGREEAGMAGGGETVHPKYMELTLVAQKKGKEVRRLIEVVVLPSESVDTIVFAVSGVNGDTLVAKGEKNSTRWGKQFLLESVGSASGRPMWVTHGGKTVWLGGQQADTRSFSGMANSGPWEIRSLLTGTERANPSEAPATLRLRTILQYKKG